PSALLHVTGTVRFSGFGAGTLQTDSLGNLTVSSDERLKNVSGSYTRSISDILKINPISYHWNATSGLDMNTEYSGFSAQNIQLAIPEAVATSSNGFLSLQDRPILAAVVNAIKDIVQIMGEFKNRLIAWLGDSTNGLPKISTDEICLKDSTGKSVCINGDKLQEILGSQNNSNNNSSNNSNNSSSNTDQSSDNNDASSTQDTTTSTSTSTIIEDTSTSTDIIDGTSTTDSTTDITTTPSDDTENTNTDTPLTP
ncbi:MAG: tail fiber domain-containing protein, partial [Candidatus Pacebacteria bacterium]|nr:tail fiber domain-containing protein [Candidatus Paceibacterota bacterium]